jgi:hypothetical protein
MELPGQGAPPPADRRRRRQQRRRRQPRPAALAAAAAGLLVALLAAATAPRAAVAPVWSEQPPQQQQRGNASATGPGRRYGHVAWADGAGGGWLLGGWGLDGAGGEGRLNDLWRTADGASWEQVGGSVAAASDGLYNASHEQVVAEIVREACQVAITVRAHVLWWGDEITWRLSGDEQVHGPFPDMSDTYVDVVVGIGQHSMIALDSYGDGWQGGWWEITMTATGEVLAGGPRDGLVGDGFSLATPFEIPRASCANVDLSPRPGARSGAAVAPAACDGGGGACAYLFGGTGHTRGVWGSLNDLWRHSEEDGWQWLSGASLPGARGRYGVLGRASRSNVPGSRRDQALWAEDNPLRVWLFGGTGSASETAPALGGIGYLSDLWLYSVSAGEWTWMGGSDQAQHAGTPTSPSGRSGHAVWVVDGRWYLWGGFGMTGPEQVGPLNDLWTLDGTAPDQQPDLCPDLQGWVDIEAYDCAGYRDNGWCGALDAADFGVNGVDANEACCFTCDGFQPDAICASCVRPWRARQWRRVQAATSDGAGEYSGIHARPGGRQDFVFWTDSRDRRSGWIFGGA